MSLSSHLHLVIKSSLVSTPSRLFAPVGLSPGLCVDPPLGHGYPGPVPSAEGRRLGGTFPASFLFLTFFLYCLCWRIVLYRVHVLTLLAYALYISPPRLLPRRGLPLSSPSSSAPRVAHSPTSPSRLVLAPRLSASFRLSPVTLPRCRASSTSIECLLSSPSRLA